MNKAFTKEIDGDEDEGAEGAVQLPAGQTNYVTPFGLERLKSELRQLMHDERPKIVEIVSWAAGNGDRSENGDYIYGKKRLREIDRRARYLTKRIESAVLVDPAEQKNRTQVFFGATVSFARDEEKPQKVTIVGVDEADMAQGKISWLSPVARALMKGRVGDFVEIRAPAGTSALEILSITYD